MKTRLIFHTPSCRRLLLIFSGWSTSPGFYSDLRAEGWDIMLVYDYTSLDFNTSVLKPYSTIFIIAWSLGVAAAETAARRHFRPGVISAAFAVNGTLSPADDRCGIPTDIYDGTASRLDPRNLRRFRHRMSGPRDPYRFPEDSSAAISEQEENSVELLIARLRDELASLRRPIAPESGTKSPIRWKRVYISDADLIFPPEAQRLSWSSHPDEPQIVSVRAGHYLPLQQVIDDVTPDLPRIGEKFSKASATYNDNATAQNMIASRLASLCEADRKEDCGMKILEIGPGSGTLTRHLGRMLKPAEATFIDLYPLQPFGIARQERYVVGDAEEWIEQDPDKGYDLIASASTIQWFADPERFFANAAAKLRPGGRLVCSTYLPGNLAELDPLRPAPLIYRTRDELSEMLGRHFSHVELSEERISIDFESPRQALMHLKLTGVGGGTSRSMTRHLLTALPPHPRFTYRSLYILAIP